MTHDTSEQWGIDPEKVCDLIAANDSYAQKNCHQVDTRFAFLGNSTYTYPYSQQTEDDAKCQLVRHNYNVWSLAKALWGTRESAYVSLPI